MIQVTIRKTADPAPDPGAKRIVLSPTVVRITAPTNGRVLGFDLENRPLAYWYDGETTSEITAFAWKWTDEDTVHTMLLTNTGGFLCGDGTIVPDGMAYDRFRGVLEGAGIVFGHNIRRHDLPMLNAGLLRRELPPLKPLLTQDTLRDYPRRKGLSASLENLAAMYGLEGEKFSMNQPAWERANRLSDDGLDLARTRVVSDVVLQERLREKLGPNGLNILGPSRVWRA